MHLTEAMMLAVGLPAVILLLGILVMAAVNTARGPRPGDAPAPSPKSETVQTPAPRGGFEISAVRRLPVWIGGVSLALSGYFLVKYSIEQGLLTVNLRLLLGFLLGLLLIAAAGAVRAAGAANGLRISQALAGSGIACLYATVYAASGIYSTVPATTGFLGLAVTTAAAIVLSLRYGLGVAVIGLLAGFLMPAFVPLPEPKALNLFGYLLALTAGLFVVARLRDWWAMAVLALLSGMSWLVMWGVGPFFQPDDARPMGLFLLGTFSVAAALVPTGARRAEWSDTTAFLSWASAAPLVTFLTVRSGYAPAEWMLFAGLGFSSCIAARFRPLQYAYAPWAFLVFSVTALLVWSQLHPPVDNLRFAILILGLAFGAGTASTAYLQPSLHRAVFLTAAVSGFYALGYFLIGPQAHDWNLLALVLAALFAIAAWRRGRDTAYQQISAVFAAAAAGFLTVSIGINAATDMLPLALAAEVALAALLASRPGLTHFRPVVATLFGLFAGLELCTLVNSGLPALMTFSSPGIGPAPLVTFGIPMLLIARAGWLVRRQRDGALAEMMEAAATALCAGFIFFGMCHLWGSCRTEFTRGVFVTGSFFAAGCAIAFFGRRHSRDAYIWGGSALFLLALFRAVTFDLVLRNPWMTGENVGQVFLLNALLLAYAMPVAWLWLGRRPQVKMPIPAELGGLLSLLFALAFVALSVRQYFHGGILRAGQTSPAEIYSYSAAGLVLGAVLLAVGTAAKDRTVRIASLLITIFTIGKVFLYDAGALDGLWRVFSFMGLGLSLLALSWFYARFVFAEKQEKK